MIVKVDKSFDKDTSRIRDKVVLELLAEIMEDVRDAENLQAIKGLKKLTGYKNYYRIRITNYRIGLRIEGKTAYFIKFLHRKDIYKYFP